MSNYISRSFLFCISLLSSLLFSVQLFAGPQTITDCSITKANGTATVGVGYTTSLTSVVYNMNNTYTITLVIKNTGVSGPSNKTLSDLCVQYGPGSLVYAEYKVISGSLTGSLNLANANPVFSSGFKIEGCSKFGDGYAGTVQVLYTIPVLQDQQIACKAGGDFNIVKFSLAELQSVYNCTLPQPPTFSPSPGVYSSPQLVAMDESNFGSTVYYTTNGTTPDKYTGTKYTGPITISANTVLKAVGYKNLFPNSAVTVGNYTISCAAPVMSPATGTYPSAQSVSITSATAGAQIYYTTDGTDPTSSSLLYGGAVSVTATQTLKAIAIKSGMGNSAITSNTYTISLPVAIPTFSPLAGTYDAAQSVTISSATPNATIYYTTDNSTPTTSGPLYSTPVTVTNNMTLKAIAVKSGMTTSSVGTAGYIINCVAPVLSPATGTYTAIQSVTMATTTPGASIYYTNDGNIPSASSTKYTGPVQVGANMTLKAITLLAGMGNSAVTTEAYTILLPVSAPTYTPVAGTYGSAQSVAISSATPGATIYYTTNGSTPTASSSQYTAPVSVGANMTIKAYAVKSGMSDSPLSSSDYIIKCATPVMSPAAGTPTSALSVSITTSTSGATIYYTTDGTTPTTSSAIYSSAVQVGQNLTLSAIAVKGGMANSDPASGTYTILMPVSAPLFSPPASTYNSAQSVTITPSVSGASIRYTTDGTIPSDVLGTLYSAAVTIGVNTRLQAIAFKSGMSNSTVTVGDYVINCSTPVLSPATGTFNSVQSVSMTTNTLGAAIYYTTDGTTPSASSSVYSVPVQVAANMTLKAIAIKSGMGNSSIATGDYRIKCGIPVLTPASGTFTTIQSVTLTSSTSGASIYYTIDGTAPGATNGTLYTVALTISANTNLRVIALKTGFENSDEATGNYIINLVKVAAPAFTPGAGTYATPESVTISSTTSGAIIRYTLDGTTPGRTTGTIVTTPVTINANATLKAFAFKDDMLDSDPVTGDYKIKTAIPVFSPAPGNYASAQTVGMSSQTSGATIRYTTDGSTPSHTIGTVYTVPVALPASATLKAISYKDGMEDSDIASGVYTIQIPKVAIPVFTPVPGKYTTPQSVIISSATEGSIIRFTTDGTVPTRSIGTVYSNPILISANTTFKAIAFMGDLTDSDVAPGNYVIALGENDTDGDGVIDSEDDYPLDPTRAYNNYYPAKGYGSLAFEDNWPFKADYDMNDMVIDYRFNQVTNALNEVVEIKSKIVVRAMGASFHNGFGIELPVTPSQVASSVVTLKNGKPVPMGTLVTADPQTGLEMHQDKAVVILFDDGFNVLPQNYAGIGVNTTPTIPWTVPDTLLMTITFKENVSAALLTNPIYNPFIFTNKTRGTEVHLPDFTPTTLANKALFKTGEDKSDPATGKYYKTANNLPWALNIYEGYDYPNEKVSIGDAFKHFVEWAQSAGTLFPDWYKDLSGYRNASNIYVHP